MGFKIHDVCKDKEKPDVELMLVDEDGLISLIAVDSNGETHRAGHLLSIDKKGRLMVYGAVNTTLGFSLDRSARLNILKI